MTHTALIAGATGLVGGFILDGLLADPYFDRVIALTRRPTGRTDKKLREVTTNFDDLGAVLADVSAHVAFCALGTTIKVAGSPAAFRAVDFDGVVGFAAAAKVCGATTLCAVSSIGASAAARNFYLRTKGETEGALIDLEFAATHIFRPSLLLGPRSGQFRFAEQLSIWPMKALAPLMLGPLRPYRAIDAQQVANAMIMAAQSPATGMAVHTYADMVGETLARHKAR